MRILKYSAIFLLLLSHNAYADCAAEIMSSPKDMMGQKFNCDNGDSYTYERDSLGDKITNDKTGEVFDADPLSTINDEYEGVDGRQFGDSLTLQRDSVLGDKIEGETVKSQVESEEEN